MSSKRKRRSSSSNDNTIISGSSELFNSNAPLHLECQAFQNSISKYIKLQSKRLLKKNNNVYSTSSTSIHDGADDIDPNSTYAKIRKKITQDLSQHAVYILQTLTLKRASLKCGIEAFEEICEQCTTLLTDGIVNSSTFQPLDQSSQNGKQQQQQQQEILQEVLQHFFLQYIHLRDGIILLTSGECRHTADSNLVLLQRKRYKKNASNSNNSNKNTPYFPSYLNSKQAQSKNRQSDGYTTLYSSKCGYSGYGWDEFHNEVVGIRRRLLDLLRRLPTHFSTRDCPTEQETEEEEEEEEEEENVSSTNVEQRNGRIWDKLLELGAEGFDMSFDVHDNEMKDLQRVLESHKDKFLSQVEQILSKNMGGRSRLQKRSDMMNANSQSNNATTGIKLILVTEDKFEKLTLKNAASIGLGLSSFTIQRQGDAFKGSDKRGALPTHANTREWVNKIMKFGNKLEALQLRVRQERQEQKKQGQKGVQRINKSSSASTSDSKPPINKKRRVIIDTDSEEDDNDDDYDKSNKTNNHAKKKQESAAESGLKVTVRKTEVSSTTSSTTKVHDIKRQLGVDMHNLEEARENLEMEEKISKEKAYAEEIEDATTSATAQELFQSDVSLNNHISEQMFELHDLIMEEKENVQLLKSVCKRKGGQDEEAWDARESLRESIMTLGIQQLELYDLSSSSSSGIRSKMPIDKSILCQAESCFEEAVRIVYELEEMNRSSSLSIPNEEERKGVSSTIAITRALLLCRGRALTNLGRAIFEQTEDGSDETRLGFVKNNHRPKGREQTVKLTKSIKHFRSAQSCAQSLRAQAITTSSVDKGASIHKVEADELESFACRWEGHALWSLSKKKESIESLRKAAGMVGNSYNEHLDKIAVSSMYDEVLQGNIRLLVEQYCSANSLIEFNTSGLFANIHTNSDKNGTETFELICEAYDHAAKISKTLAQLKQLLVKSSDCVLDHDIVESRTIIGIKNEFIKQWKEKKASRIGCVNSNTAVNISLLQSRRTFPTPHRNDIYTANNIPSHRTGQQQSSEARRLSTTPKQASTKTKQGDRGSSNTATGPQDDAFDNFGNDQDVETQQESLDEEETDSITYHLWGDDLLQSMGKDLNAFPGCAPEKPPEMLRELGLNESE